MMPSAQAFSPLPFLWIDLSLPSSSLPSLWRSSEKRQWKRRRRHSKTPPLFLPSSRTFFLFRRHRQGVFVGHRAACMWPYSSVTFLFLSFSDIQLHAGSAGSERKNSPGRCYTPILFFSPPARPPPSPPHHRIHAGGDEGTPVRRGRLSFFPLSLLRPLFSLPPFFASVEHATT